MKKERVCVSKRGAENCGNADDWTREGMGELGEEEEEQEEQTVDSSRADSPAAADAGDNPLLKAVGGKLRGHIADCISPIESERERER